MKRFYERFAAKIVSKLNAKSLWKTGSVRDAAVLIESIARNNHSSNKIYEHLSCEFLPEYLQCNTMTLVVNFKQIKIFRYLFITFYEAILSQNTEGYPQQIV